MGDAEFKPRPLREGGYRSTASIIALIVLTFE